MKDPIDHYEQHRDVYDRTSERLNEATSHFAEAPRTEQEMLLNQAVTFALISTQTRVELHEKGYLNTLDATSFSELEEGLLDAGVNYYRNKAKYIFYNMTEPNYDRVFRHYDAGEFDKMHRAIADEFKGVSTRKAAFAMANIVTTDKMCIDTHIAQFAGFSPDEIYNGVVVEKYEAQCQEVLEQVNVDAEPYLQQWVAFDAQQETVTTHDAWFMSLPI